MVEEILDLHCGQWWEHQKVAKHLDEMSENHRSVIEAFRCGGRLEARHDVPEGSTWDISY